jgi:hypothetical protein
MCLGKVKMEFQQPHTESMTYDIIEKIVALIVLSLR